jgi:hypothetical protein
MSIEKRRSKATNISHRLQADRKQLAAQVDADPHSGRAA